MPVDFRPNVSVGPASDLTVNSLNATTTVSAGEEIGTSGSLAGGSATISEGEVAVIMDVNEIDHSSHEIPITWDQVFAAAEGGSVPTGTGVRYVTDGTEDAAAKDVSVIQIIQDLLTTACEGRLDPTTAGVGSSLSWGVAGQRISLFDSTAGVWKLITVASAPAILNTATDLDSVMFAGGTTPYDLFAEYADSLTTFNLVAKKWTNATTRAVTPAYWQGVKCYDNTTDAGKKRRFIGTVLPYRHWLPSGAWNGAVTYEMGAPCTSGGHTWVSIQSVNLNHEPPNASYWQDAGAVDDGRGVFCDQINLRMILNTYNQQNKALGVVNPYTGSTTDTMPGSGTWAIWMKDANINSLWVVEFLSDGIAWISLTAAGLFAAVSVAIAIDSKTVPFPSSSFEMTVSTPSSVAVAQCAAGYHYAAPLLTGTGNAYHWYQSAPSFVKSQFNGTWRG